MVLFGGAKKSDAEILKRHPISEKFEIGDEIGSGGVGFLWRIYKCVEKKTGEEASVFYFDKSHSTKIPSSSQRKGRGTVTSLFKHDVHELCAHRHARVLNVIEPLKENSDCLIFATEPLLGSLANLLPKREGYKTEIPRDVKDFRFSELEIRSGILQIAEGVSYVHNVFRTLHGAISPENIYITKWGAWKLAGLFFSETFPPNVHSAEMKVKNVKWHVSSSVVTFDQPNLDFTAPDYFFQPESSALSDMYSLGLTICAVFNNGKPLLDTKQRLKDYELQLPTLETQVQQNLLSEMGPNLAEAVMKMLSLQPKQRPSAQLFTLIKFFDDQAIMCLRQLEDVQHMEQSEKVQFYSTQLTSTLYLIPEELWFSRILPRLVYDMRKNRDLISAIVRPLVHMLQHGSPENTPYLHTVIEEVVNGVTPENINELIALLEGIDVIIKNISDLEEKMIQLMSDSLRHDSPNVQDAAISCLPKLKPFLDTVCIAEDIIPAFVYIFQNNFPSYIHCHALESALQIVHLINDSAMLKLLDCLICIKLLDVTVVTALAKLYTSLLTDGSRFRVSANFVAGKLLPSFSPLLVTENLKESQLNRMLQCLQTMVDYIARGKLGSWKKQSVNSSSSEYVLQVPFPQRPQRHSIGGAQLPELTVTSPTCGGLPRQNSSSSSNSLSTSFPNVQQHPRSRKLSGGPALMMNRLDASRSQPNSPGQRRHSLQVHSRPSSFTNLSHNLACMLPSWRK